MLLVKFIPHFVKDFHVFEVIGKESQINAINYPGNVELVGFNPRHSHLFHPTSQNIIELLPIVQFSSHNGSNMWTS